MTTQTPMMAQWHACKENAKDALLFFRLGDFYEAFYNDAEVISKHLGLTLTARQEIPMCGVPHHTAEVYIDKLIGKGYKVAVAEQTEKDSKGLIKREIARIVTPGTIVNSQLLNDKKNNYFACIVQIGTRYFLSVLDLTTAEFQALEFEKEQELIDEIFRLRPAEFLVSEEFPFFKELSHFFTFMVNVKKTLDPKRGAEVLEAHFDKSPLRGAAAAAAGSLLLYLKEELNLSLEYVKTIQTQPHHFMSLDRATLRNLELTESMQDSSTKFTLLELLDETSTPMGGRLLRHWLKHPLLSLPEIEARQNAIATFIQHADECKKVRSHLNKVRDLERLMMKIQARYATPRDIYALGVSLSQIPEIQVPFYPLNLTDPISSRILSAINDEPPIRIGEGEIFRDGYHAELDQLRLLSKESMTWMARYQAQLREETGIKTLRVGFTNAFGYYIEVSRAQSEKIPPTFQRRQTLVNAERFITEELKQFEHQILTAEERSKALESSLFEQLRVEIASHANAIHEIAKTIARFDALLALAKVAVDQNYVRPTLDESEQLDIVEGRHPILLNSLGNANFIPNDTHLNKDAQLMLITGPNMAGKSTYIRQVALIVIMAQIGSYVPARSAHIGLVDKVFSRIGASDDLARGQSTFMVEMSETANILNNATDRSLVLLDEIGRGTSTYDGISIAWAVAEYLLSKKAKTLFATHYWELTRMEMIFPNALNFQIAVQEVPDGIVFLRKIIRGGTDKSYGIHVAKLAGLPARVIKRAQEMLHELEKKPSKKQDHQLSFLDV